MSTVVSQDSFEFTPENFRNPLPHMLARSREKFGVNSAINIIDIPVVKVRSNTDLEGYGFLVNDPSEFTAEDKTFEIKKWPVAGWRQLDPETGDEAGTTEGTFEVHWAGDFYRGKNLAINTVNNTYLDGIGCSNPEKAQESEPGYGMGEECSDFGNCIYLWMTDYHPDGGQLFFPLNVDADQDSNQGMPFFVCLAKNTIGDDITPQDMRGFCIPPGKGIYIHPGTWHNGFYINKTYRSATCFTRQGRVHARVSCSWVEEFNCMLRLNLSE